MNEVSEDEKDAGRHTSDEVGGRRPPGACGLFMHIISSPRGHGHAHIRLIRVEITVNISESRSMCSIDSSILRQLDRRGVSHVKGP